jgi:hypothetical protein
LGERAIDNVGKGRTHDLVILLEVLKGDVTVRTDMDGR